jgi:hypothetical protein
MTHKKSSGVPSVIGKKQNTRFKCRYITINIHQKKKKGTEINCMGAERTSSGGSYFWPGKVYTFFSLTLVVVFAVIVFDEPDIVFDFTFTFKNFNKYRTQYDINTTDREKEKISR